MDWFNELCKRTSAPAIAAELLRSRANVDVSNLFDKLGVWTRAQAIVFARDRGFRT